MKRGSNIGARRQQGIAFILVLWVVIMLTVLLGSFAVIARTERMQSRHLFDSTQARYAAEAGLNLAIYELRKNDPLQRWIGDGRPYKFSFGGAEVEVSIVDDAGKIDLNTADRELLRRMLIATAGKPDDEADKLADAIIDWRDPDDIPSVQGAEKNEYRSANLPYGPRNAPFETVAELQQVLGMDYATFARVEQGVTIYSGRAFPSAAYAPLQSLLALNGMTIEFANQLIERRQQIQPGAPYDGLTLPDGTPVVADGSGVTYSVKSRATLANGASTVLDGTVRLGGTGVDGRPYAILRWRDGEES
ncbi:MAG: hypothetical protein ABIR16_05330 [Dokdonella sp.]